MGADRHACCRQSRVAGIEKLMRTTAYETSSPNWKSWHMLCSSLFSTSRRLERDTKPTTSVAKLQFCFCRLQHTKCRTKFPDPEDLHRPAPPPPRLPHPTPTVRVSCRQSKLDGEGICCQNSCYTENINKIQRHRYLNMGDTVTCRCPCSWCQMRWNCEICMGQLTGDHN